MWSTFLAVVLSVVGAESGEPCSVLTGGEIQIVQKTNEARIAAGLPPLVVDCVLMGSSRRHARRMAAEAAMFHSSGVAENVAAGQQFADAAVRTWLNSNGHRANMMSRRYTRIGVAGFISADGKAFWVQQFR